MLRSETTANGPYNIPEFGSVKTEAGFKALYAMSPYAHVRDGVKYPAVLVKTGINDPRVPCLASRQARSASAGGYRERQTGTAARGLRRRPRRFRCATCRQKELSYADQFSFALCPADALSGVSAEHQ